MNALFQLLAGSARQLAEALRRRASARKIDDLPMTSNIQEGPGRVHVGLKRALDIVLASMLLPLSFPMLLTAALAIKVNSHGPVFFVQERVGKHGRRFNILKLRSMVTDAEKHLHVLTHRNEADGPIFKMRNDPRTTAVGRFLRRYSIDELPQLVNVLCGDMSIVGPRPHLSREVDQYGPDDCRRLQVKPGMTGLAQVSGRSNLRWKETLQLDLHYVDRWHLGFDAQIIARTFRAVLESKGAA